MTRRLYNWNFKEVSSFLKRHDFVHIHTRGSHYYYQAIIDKQVRLVEVPFHTNKTIKPRTLKDSIIRKSGISLEHWMMCTEKRCSKFK